METMHLVLDTDLLKATDLAANRRGYLAQSQREEEFRRWEDAAAWPEPRAGVRSAFADSRPRFRWPGIPW